MIVRQLKRSTKAARALLASAQPTASTSKRQTQQLTHCQCGAALLHSRAAPASVRLGPSRALRSFPAQPQPHTAQYSTQPSEQLDQLQHHITANHSKKLVDSFESLSPAALESLDRATFAALLGATSVIPNAGLRWKFARKLYKLSARRGWSLDARELTLVLTASERWIHFRKANAARGGVARVDWPMLERAARQLTAIEFEDGEAREAAAWLMFRVAAGRLRRISSSSAHDQQQAPPPSSDAAAFAVSIYNLGLQLSDKQPEPTPSLAGTSVLVSLLAHHPQLGLAHLHAMLAHNQTPQLAQLHPFLISITADPTVDSYDHARHVLDSACASPARGGELDSLLEERLRRLEREDDIAREPMLAFMRWLAEELPREAKDAEASITKKEGVQAGLKVWDVVYGSRAWYEGSRFDNLRALQQLARDACDIQEAQSAMEEGQGRTELAPLAVTRLAIELAGKHLTPPMLANTSHKLLNAVTIHSRDFELAMSFYATLRTRCSAVSPRPFQWHTALRPAYAALILDADAQRDAHTVIQLYLDWTGDGLVLPADLWKFVWRAVGRRSQVEEVMRLVNDYEEAGRGKVPAPIVAQVMRASASERRIVKTLQLLAYWRSRARTVGNLGGGRSDVPLEAYEAVLELLSTSHTDRRAAGMNVFQALMDEGHKPTTRTWNYLLAAQVFRPMFHIEDVDNAGRAFNSLIGAGCKPDARTYSLLTHGFVRLANSTMQKRQVGLQAALKTFKKATDEGLLLRGEPVAGLMRALARSGQFEDAKEVNEAWWRALGENEQGRREEMKLMRFAADAVEWIESKAIARKADDEGAEETAEEAAWPEVQEDPKDAEEDGLEGEDSVDQRSAEAFGPGVSSSVGAEDERSGSTFSFTSARPGGAARD